MAPGSGQSHEQFTDVDPFASAFKARYLAAGIDDHRKVNEGVLRDCEWNVKVIASSSIYEFDI